MGWLNFDLDFMDKSRFRRQQISASKKLNISIRQRYLFSHRNSCKIFASISAVVVTASLWSSRFHYTNCFHIYSKSDPGSIECVCTRETTIGGSLPASAAFFDLMLDTMKVAIAVVVGVQFCRGESSSIVLRIISLDAHVGNVVSFVSYFDSKSRTVLVVLASFSCLLEFEA